MPWRLNECICLRGDTTHYYFVNFSLNTIFLKLLSFIVLANLKLLPKFQVRMITPSGCSVFFFAIIVVSAIT
jgi:hypothetical protein